MAVKRVVNKVQRRLPAARAAGGETAQGLALPTEAKEPCADLFAYMHLLYGRAGIGKSTLGAAFPSAIMFSCERVSQGLRCHDFNAENGGVKDWATFRAGVNLLCSQKHGFKTVVIDTVEAAYDQCLDWVCKRAGVQHPSDLNDFGKTWRAITDEFDEQVRRLNAAGLGIVLISHAKEVEITSPTGDTYTRIQPSLSGRMFEWIKQKTDFVLYADYLKVDGKAQRVIITTGDDIVDAKHPGDAKMPTFVPFLRGAEGVRMLQEAFAGEDVGISIDRIKVGKQTSEAAAAFVVGKQVQAARKIVARKKA